VPPDRTIYEGVHTLPPGHVLVYQDGRVDVTAYWELPAPAAADLPLADAVEEFIARFDTAVSTQLVADVPVAAFVSGGADSTSVVAAAAPRSPRLMTLAFGFGEGVSELPYAAAVARQYDTRHVEIVDEGSNLEETFLASQPWFDEPFADSSSVPYFILAERARQHAKVVLTGDGGDELMAGYAQWYPMLGSIGRIGPRDRVLRRMLGMARSFCRRMNRGLPAAFVRQLEGLDRAASTASVAEAHFSQYAFFRDDDLRRLGLTPPPWPEFWRAHEKTDTLDDALRMDLSGYLPGDILVKADRMSMAHGLELRAPFLDRDLAEFCIALPHRLKLHGSRDKVLLREAFASSWPPSVRKRPKQGFGAPVRAWLKRPRFDELVAAYLDDPSSRVFDLVDFAGSRRYVAQRGYPCWILLVLATWLETPAAGGAS
jgi:asparagine synthase (glutamine-hydrolysing)